jgi:signal-transduction protein with cAMP-binding, CBS, and nucleotidyltransferase domain
VKAVNTYSRVALIAAQLLTLLSLVLGLNFVIHTTGGSLFLFASIGPVLVGGAILLFAAVAIYRFRASHNLFEIETLKPGEVVFQQGEAGECAYFIHSGKVEVVKDGAVIATLAKDHYFGEMALLSSSPRNATVRAVEETQVAVLGKSNFLRLLNVLPATKEDILKTVQVRAMQQAGKTK